MSITEKDEVSENRSLYVCDVKGDKVPCEFFDFGNAEIGSVKKISSAIDSQSPEQRVYTIGRDNATNSEGYVFYVDPEVAIVDPYETFIYTIIYTPKIPSSTSFDYFSVYDDTGTIRMKFGTKGSSLGPAVKSSAQKLSFRCWGPVGVQHKTVKLTNESTAVSAQFQFVGLGTHSAFRVDLPHGRVRRHGFLYLCITFQPTMPGAFCKTLFCLVHNQAPLTLTLEGIWALQQPSRPTLVVASPLWPHRPIGFEGYMHTVSPVACRKPPPLSLSVSSIDFGYAAAAGLQPAVPTPVTLTSHVQSNVIVTWEQDDTSTFSIQPPRVIIAGRSVALFQVYFRPARSKRMYHEELEASCICDEGGGDYIPAPYMIRLSLMGHSFPEDDVIWPGEFSVSPPEVLMPPCVPPLPVYSTFKIRRFGSLPIMFKLTPTIADSRYVVKPEQGVLKDELQILVVQLSPDGGAAAAYNEDWTLLINRHEYNMRFLGFAEPPCLKVGVDNLVTLPPTYPGCEQEISVPIRNVTRHCIRFYMAVVDHVQTVKIQEPFGTLSANELLYSMWRFRPAIEGGHSVRVCCEAIAVDSRGQRFGARADIFVTAIGTAEDTHLLALPEHLDLGVLAWSETATGELYVFNPGRAPMHYVLHTKPRSLLTVDGEVTLAPVRGTIKPGGQIPVKVGVEAQMEGPHVVEVSYSLSRTHGGDDLPVPKRAIATVSYCCVLPCVKIVDVRSIASGPLYSKLCLWRILHIDSLNELLTESPPGSRSQYIKLHLPEAVCDSKPLEVQLVLRNPTAVVAEWRMRRRPICDCRTIMVSVSISFRKTVYDCPHRELTDIQPRSGCLQPLQCQLLTLVARYDLLGTTELQYELFLPCDRQLLISLELTAIHPESTLPSVYQLQRSLGRIFVGEVEPIARAVWLYNTTGNEAAYSLNDEYLEEQREENHGCNVIRCLNPTGKLPPMTCSPLIFTFRPLELINYKAELPLTLSDDEVDQQTRWLTLTGDGVVTPQHILGSTNQFTVSATRTWLPDMRLPVDLSLDYVVIDQLAPHSTVYRIFFINNNTTDTLYYYDWNRQVAPNNCLSVRVKPTRGQLPPQSQHCLRLQVTSRSLECELTMVMACRLLDLTAKRKHDKSLLLLNESERLLAGHFTITEEGFFQAKSDVKVEPSPEPRDLALGVSVRVTSEAGNTSLRHAPPDDAIEMGLALHGYEVASDITQQELPVIKLCLERMLWSLLHSEPMQSAAEQVFSKERPVRYCQLLAPTDKKKHLVRLSAVPPPRAVIARVLRSIILLSVHQYFDLGPLRRHNGDIDTEVITRVPRWPPHMTEDDDISTISREILREAYMTFSPENKIKVPIGK